MMVQLDIFTEKSLNCMLKVDEFKVCELNLNEVVFLKNRNLTEIKVPPFI